MMKCYDCMEDGNDTEATCICIACGKGLCSDHCKELELPVSVGQPPHVQRLPKGLPRILCKYCFDQTIEDGFD
ncbi:DUF2180 family protein [Methanolobus bombayensis]|uniref:DUF2180 family protein n=1 Tax=Methanolobus bombayensis TaxID=38023 RepID=UPI001AE9ECF8|nr:DUF2180 family protein [Methanolobus bombayensis]MBP1907932.1 hypothetical protein [Methanolobus bombayensis]